MSRSCQFSSLFFFSSNNSYVVSTITKHQLSLADYATTRNVSICFAIDSISNETFETLNRAQLLLSCILLAPHCLVFYQFPPWVEHLCCCLFYRLCICATCFTVVRSPPQWKAKLLDKSRADMNFHLNFDVQIR